VIAVRDNGLGIELAMLARVFEPFIQADLGQDRNRGGLGLGLALVRGLAELHGGTVEARSDGIGQGSAFSVRLPLNSRTVAVARKQRRDASSIASLGVLVVDDNRYAAESLAMLLRTTGADVHVAHDGPAALEEFELREPNIVLLDIGMPEMDGYEVARRLREISSPQRVAIVALTGWGQDEDRQRVRAAGFDHHLVKPVDLASLQALLTSLAAARAGKKSA
jgi:CheY-like chemotaxis protein